jgi:hypothetical protein
MKRSEHGKKKGLILPVLKERELAREEKRTK